MTIANLKQILYSLTYENGLTFGTCGNANDSQLQMLVDAINASEKFTVKTLSSPTSAVKTNAISGDQTGRGVK